MQGKEEKMNIVLFETLISMILCIGLILLKCLGNDTGILEEIYHYLITDIVFPA